MRRFCFCLLLTLFATAGTARAQLVGSMRAGAVATTLSGETTTDFRTKLGWGGGVGFGYDFAGGLSLQAEILYLIKGAVSETTTERLEELLGQVVTPGTEERNVELTWRLTYVEAPLLLVYTVGTPSRYRPRIFAGPSIARNMSARAEYRTEGSDFSFDARVDGIRRTEYGLIVGAGVELDAGLERLTLDARALLGRTNVRTREPELRNRGIAVLLGIIF